MTEVWVANASPIIVLAKAGFLNLLKDLPNELLLPRSSGCGRPGRSLVRSGAPGFGERVGPARGPRSIPSELVEWALEGQ